MIIIEIYGNPIPLKRPRACKRGDFIQMYDSQTKEKEIVRWQAKAQYKEEPIKTPLLIDMLFGLPIPKGTSRVRTNLMLQNEMVPMKKPDLDNLIKFILDCLNEILFDDDSQIIEIKARKCYMDNPRTVVRAVCLNRLIDEVKNEDNNGNG
jgi:Holliday junction resolvase RusA-like endonuclease